ncbi:MAG: MucR family transcriptional regulator, partial [Alphaproteobacteria bacterium]
ERPAPAVPIRKSVTPNFVICLEDGKKLKMLKRHLKTAYGLTPEQYRERWGLAADYPMVAPNYARQRSKLAKQIGLGRRPRRRR